MAKVGLDNGVLILPEQAAPSSESGVGKIYATTGQKVSFLGGGGTDTELGAGASTSILDDRTQFNNFTPIIITKDA